MKMDKNVKNCLRKIKKIEKESERKEKEIDKFNEKEYDRIYEEYNLKYNLENVSYGITDEIGKVVDPLTIAFNGKCIVYCLKDEYFKVRGYISNVLINHSYLDLMIEAEKQIIETEDFHHVLFDGFDIIKEISPNIYEIDLDLES